MGSTLGGRPVSSLIFTRMSCRAYGLRCVRAEERTSCRAHELGTLVSDELTYDLRPLPLARARLLVRGLEGHEPAPRGVEKLEPRAHAAQPALVERHTVLSVPHRMISFTRPALRGPALHNLPCVGPHYTTCAVGSRSPKPVKCGA